MALTETVVSRYFVFTGPGKSTRYAFPPYCVSCVIMSALIWERVLNEALVALRVYLQVWSAGFSP